MKSKEPSRLRIFIGLVEIAGYSLRLRNGLIDMGATAVNVDLSGHPFKYSTAGPRPMQIRLVEAVSLRRHRRPGSRLPLKVFWTAVEAFLRVFLLAWAIRSFDVFLLTFGSSFIGGREFWLLRRLHKQLVFVYFGSDTRPPYMDGADHQRFEVGSNPAACARRARTKKMLVRRAERHATAIVCHPPSAHFLERPFISFQDVGIPTQVVPVETSSPADGEDNFSRLKAVRILHAPSNPELKGTRRLHAAIEAVRLSGRPVELVEITNQPNASVLREIAACDFVVDQLYSDTPMAGFAAEAAAAGKPAIVGGLDWSEVEREVGSGALAPSLRCHPDELEAAIIRLVDDAPYRRELGTAARDFVLSRWTPKAVAERYLRITAGDVPRDWFRDPNDLRYAYGWGLPAAQVAASIRGVVSAIGPGALQLSDKPELEQRLVELSAQ